LVKYYNSVTPRAMDAISAKYDHSDGGAILEDKPLM
jgi:hypothetical protein